MERMPRREPSGNDDVSRRDVIKGAGALAVGAVIGLPEQAEARPMSQMDRYEQYARKMERMLNKHRELFAELGRISSEIEQAYGPRSERSLADQDKAHDEVLEILGAELDGISRNYIILNEKKL